ncbi:MAG: DUF2726 domain-containing protein [Anaerolineae bacterium]|nr:DUF2726 domain-containing protein [Anaerolineae bacterium]
MTTTDQNPGCLTALLQFFQSTPKTQEASDQPLPYALRDDFLSSAELSFYHVLAGYVEGRWMVLSKVRLADIFFVKRPHENKSSFSRISQKHIDFLLCHPKTMTPVVGIELDDGSHKQAKRKQRDTFVEQVFEAAGLPLVRIPNQRAYSRLDLAVLDMQLAGAGKGNGVAWVRQESVSTPTETAPMCPKCGVAMVRRITKRGHRVGQAFYGCGNYPRCREMKNLGSNATTISCRATPSYRTQINTDFRRFFIFYQRYSAKISVPYLATLIGQQLYCLNAGE